MAIQELSVSGYRSIRKLRLKLKRINILTGPNGCGKSNLYNSMVLLARAAEGGLARAIAEEGGMPSLLWAGPRRMTRKSEPVRVRLGVVTADFSFELACGLPAPGQPKAFLSDPEVKEEYVWYGGKSARTRRPGCATQMAR